MKAINRRQFLVSSVTGATGLAAGTAALGALKLPAADSPSAKVILALMGAGGRGTQLTSGMAKLPDAEL
jgi:hypothetical protein